ncbi:MAG: hypothetical protein J5781_03785 [Clostridia bacterium]|nr:hypothetical protein [Clostridia bacterium]
MKKFLLALTSCVLLLTFVLGAAACNDKKHNEKTDKTLAAIGLAFDGEEKPMTKIRTLDDIYFPEGIFDTELGMWIYNASTDSYERTNSPQGRALFDKNKPTFISTHGMGGGAYADEPQLYAPEYNVLCFVWGTYAGEDNSRVFQIVNKVWFSNYKREETNAAGNIITHYGARWQRVAFDDEEKTHWHWAEWEEDDPSDASVIEMFCAFYYDFFKDLADYDGSSIHLFGHSYGGMISIGATNLLITAYKCGLLPAYMLPDMVTLLDPYFMKATVSNDIPWLGNYSPDFGNVCEVAYQTALDCQKLGITVRLHRGSKGVAATATNEFLNRKHLEVPTSYWNFVNNVVYSHLDNESSHLFSSDESLHNYGWDWFTTYYEGKMLTDAAATKTTEQALCFKMDYDASFARTGIKYQVNLNGTRDSNDDVLTSFFRKYEIGSSDADDSETYEQIAECTGKAKIAGFAYFDRNGNGKLDERVRDHLSGCKITVKNSSGEVVYSGTTGINGYYEIEVSEEGTYTISAELPTGYILSTENASLQTSVTIVDGLHQLALAHFGAKKDW